MGGHAGWGLLWLGRAVCVLQVVHAVVVLGLHLLGSVDGMGGSGVVWLLVRLQMLQPERALGHLQLA